MKARAVIAALAIGIVTPALADRALIVGIDVYQDSQLSFQLPGASFRDSERINLLLKHTLGYQAKDIRILRDKQATRAAILDSLKNWLGQTKPGERAFFYYVGHGHFTKDLNGDEEDGLDETVVPFDAKIVRSGGAVEVRNMVIDDEIGAALSALKGRQVTAVLDSCHSGTVTRSIGAVSAPNLAARTPQLQQLTRSIASDRSVAKQKATGSSADAVSLDGGIITWTAVSPSQLALIDQDASPDFHGVFTAAFADGIEKGLADKNNNGTISNQELLDFVRQRSADYCKRRPETCEMGLTPSLEGVGAATKVAALNPVALAAAAAAPPIEKTVEKKEQKKEQKKVSAPDADTIAAIDAGLQKLSKVKEEVAATAAPAGEGDEDVATALKLAQEAGTTPQAAAAQADVAPESGEDPIKLALAAVAAKPEEATPDGVDPAIFAAALETAAKEVEAVKPPEGVDPVAIAIGAVQSLGTDATKEDAAQAMTQALEVASAAVVDTPKSGEAVTQGKVTPEKVLDVLGASLADDVTLEQDPPSPVKLGTEDIHFRVTSPRDGFLVLLSISDEGELVQLFPNALSDKQNKDGRIKAGSTITVPDKNYGIRFDATSVTSGTVMALVAVDPLKLSRSFMTRKIDVVSTEEANTKVLPEIAESLSKPAATESVDTNTKPVGRSVATLRYEITN